MSDQAQLEAELIKRGLVTAEKLNEVVAEQARTKKSLSNLLIDDGVVDEADLVAMLCERVGLEYVDLAEYPIDPLAASAVSDAMTRRYQVIPIAWEGSTLVLAVSDPSNIVARDDIRSLTKADIRVVVSTRAGIEAAINRMQRLDSDMEDMSAMALDQAEGDDSSLSQLGEVTEDAPIVKLANLLIRQAVQDRASDIHVEPGEYDIRMRYRIDGVLHEVMRSPKRVQAGLISRLKIMADLNIAEKRIPQDGRVSTKIGGRSIELRVATLPTVFGEKVVMRILDKGTALLDLADLGFLPETMARYETMFHKPSGTILVTGPTGSGKSTTLYSTLNQLNDPSKNIITVEDPVEYRLAGINQVQVNVKAGMTFSAALRSILRSDPDIVLVGEIRDKETATIAMEAALTGHLVLSTLHTNDSCSTPTRLMEMGLEPYLVASSVDCVVAQRLCRRLCERCKVPARLSPGEIKAMGWDVDESIIPEDVFKAVGCGACGKTGYLGRFALHEVLLIDEDIEAMIAARAHAAELQHLAVARGMLTLRDAGMAQVSNGLTTIEEIMRVVA